jgi:DNA-binding CsgD family transcriptional regulator
MPRPGVRGKAPELGDPFTPREEEVLDALSEGATNGEAAVKLGISIQTLKNHVTSIHRKTGVRTLVGVYHQQGWIRKPDIMAEAIHAALIKPEKDKKRAKRIRAEYQRFYDFVAECDTSIVDAWHFGENVRVQAAARKNR